MLAAPEHSQKRSAKTYAALNVDRRVLTTPTRTIAISSIATVTVGTDVTQRPRMLFGLLAVLFAFSAAAIWMANTDSPTSVPQLMSAALALIAATLTYQVLRPDDKTHYLIISTNDGIKTRFTAMSDHNLLDEARRVIAHKINTGDENATFAIDFIHGTIKAVSANSGALHQNSAAGDADDDSFTSPATGGRPAQHPHGPFEGHGPASQVPRVNGSQAPHTRASWPNQPQATPASSNQIDFGNYLPAVVEMQRFYSRQPNAEHLDHRLSELELLMRSGAQTGPQRTRIAEISRELEDILAPYPQAAQLFESIAVAVTQD